LPVRLATSARAILPIVDVWAVHEALQGQDEGSLSAAELSLVAVGDLRAEVNNGGFDRYLRYSGANTAARALAACRSTTGLGELGVLLAGLTRVTPGPRG
jgi:hypothetical protein